MLLYKVLYTHTYGGSALFTDEQRIRIACQLVRDERAVDVIEVSDTTSITIRGITANKLLCAARQVSITYHARKSEKIQPDFEEIVEDMVRITFKDEQARHIAKHVLGHFFAWRRNKRMPKEAYAIAHNFGFILL